MRVEEQRLAGAGAGHAHADIESPVIIEVGDRGGVIFIVAQSVAQRDARDLAEGGKALGDIGHRLEFLARGGGEAHELAKEGLRLLAHCIHRRANLLDCQLLNRLFHRIFLSVRHYLI